VASGRGRGGHPMGRAGIGRPGLGFGFSVLLADGGIFVNENAQAAGFWRFGLCFGAFTSKCKVVQINL